MSHSSPTHTAADHDSSSSPSPPPSTSPSPTPPQPLPDNNNNNRNTNYFIELYFDAALENQVLKSWNALARRQITDRLIDLSSRPHLNLLSINSPSSISSISSSLRSAVSRFSPLPLSLSAATIISPNPNSSDTSSNSNDFFFVPTPTMSLLTFHSGICDVIRKEIGEGLVLPEEYRPDAWLPLCPAALDVPRGQMADALALLQDLLKAPVSGFGMEIAVVERLPNVREVFSVSLGGGSAGIDG